MKTKKEYKRDLNELLIKHAETTSQDLILLTGGFVLISLIGNYFNIFLVTNETLYQISLIGIAAAYLLTLFEKKALASKNWAPGLIKDNSMTDDEQKELDEVL